MSNLPVATVHQLQQCAASLLLYQSVLETATGQAFLKLLDTLKPFEVADIRCLQAYGHWFSALAATGMDWPTHLLHQILQSDNPFTQSAQKADRSQLPAALIAAAQQDLRSLQQLYRCTATQISEWVQAAAALPTPPIAWELNKPAEAEGDRPAIYRQFEQAEDWGDLVDELAAHYRQAGVGLLAQYRAFRWQSGQLVGIAHPDPIQLHELVGYDLPRAALIQNTEALLAGYPALHVLLYGSRGTGKSSLVKALLHRYAPQGLRLVEVAKGELRDLPLILDRLRDAPQKFILFVDDLSFEEDDDAYKALKVVLEGNLTARPPNIVVYATSNRRHLIREFFGDRPRPSDADEVHAWDTMQEKLSFSDRFGLTLTFEPTNQDTYLQIIRHLAEQANLTLAPQDLEFRALQWATRHNGRSGRSARQFIDFLRAELALTAPFKN